MSKLLIDSPPLQLLRPLALAIGVNEAIVIQQIHYYETANELQRRQGIKSPEFIRKSYSEWTNELMIWSKPTIIRIFNSLEKQNLLIVQVKNYKKSDRTKGYKINRNTLDSLEPFNDFDRSCDQNDHMDEIKMITSPDQNDLLFKDKNYNKNYNKNYILPSAEKDLEENLKMIKKAGARIKNFTNANKIIQKSGARKIDPIEVGKKLGASEIIIPPQSERNYFIDCEKNEIINFCLEKEKSKFNWGTQKKHIDSIKKKFPDMTVEKYENYLCLFLDYRKLPDQKDFWLNKPFSPQYISENMIGILYKYNEQMKRMSNAKNEM